MRELCEKKFYQDTKFKSDFNRNHSDDTRAYPKKKNRLVVRVR